MTQKWSRIGLIAGVLLAGVVPALAADEDYPTRPVRIIIPYAPGGINDVGARVVATYLSNRLGKQFIAENKTGAGGLVGFEAAALAPHDGYTLVVMSISNAVQPALYAKLPYDTLKSFDPVAMIVTSRFTLAVNPTLPAHSLKEFVALAKAKPGDLQYASGGIGGALHLGMELLRIQAGIDLIHIPFRGAGPAAIDVIAGNTKAVVATVSSVSSHIRSGKLRGLAVAAPQRNAAIPDVPTFIEAGMPEYEAGNWIGLAAPAGTPKPIIDKLAKEIAAIQDIPEVQQQMHNRGAELERLGPAEFRAYIEKEIAKWGHVVREAKIPAQ